MLYLGKNFAVREWQKGDENILALHANNFNIWKYVRDSFPHPYTFNDATNWVEMNLKLKTKLNFAITVDDDPVGSIGMIPGTDIHKKNMEIGYWLSEEYWGEGIVTEAIKWLIEYCFNHFDVDRIWAAVFSNNSASAKVLLKNGFVHEATHKNAIFKNNEYLDECIYSLCKL